MGNGGAAEMELGAQRAAPVKTAYPDCFRKRFQVCGQGLQALAIISLADPGAVDVDNGGHVVPVWILSRGLPSKQPSISPSAYITECRSNTGLS